MPAELGGSQISSLLEALPGIASVLRSPVADALIKAMRAAAGLADFTSDDAEELVRYAVRRGLIGPDEGDRVMAEVQEGLRKKKPVAVKKAPAKKRKGYTRKPRTSPRSFSAAWSRSPAAAAICWVDAPCCSVAAVTCSALDACETARLTTSWACAPSCSVTPRFS